MSESFTGVTVRSHCCVFECLNQSPHLRNEHGPKQTLLCQLRSEPRTLPRCLTKEPHD